MPRDQTGTAEKSEVIGAGSAFDAQHPPSREIIDQCVHCGFCLPVCPTYALWNEEMDSPRGRIYLMKLAADGQAAINSQWVGHFDTCLGCMACMTACPSGVDYGKLIEATRAQIERKYDRGRLERLYRRLIFGLFTRPERLRLMEALLPELPATEAVAEVTPAVGEKRRRVGLLLGCVQREFFPHVNAATARVLAAEGCEVVSRAEQSCCGALLVHAGEEDGAMALARLLINVFERAGVDAIVTNAAGCGSNVKEYGHLLRDDAQYAARAKEFSAKCQDISETLAYMGPRAKRNPLRLKVAFHDSCHLQHAQGVRAQPRNLLAAIPELELLEIPEAAICCGSAGIYNLVQPNAANALGDRKAGLIASLDADVVVTGNPGCILQLQVSLERMGKKVPVLHTIQLLDASIRGR